MTDDIFSVATGFADVASLAQGYMNRADGERLLLPLPSACRQGAGVRFVVYLADGTPAFAGAGLCAQISDQGGTVPAEQRYETLLDTLQFDERSRPVYDYIVAVRSAAYAQQGEADDADVVVADAGADADEVHDVLASYDAEPATAVSEADFEPAGSDAPQAWAEAAAEPELPADDGEPTQLGSWSQPEQASAWSQPAAPDAWQQAELAPEPEPEPEPGPEPAVVEQTWSVSDPLPSFIPPPLPTGLLTRPARTTHWQPAPPRRPTPRPATGLFRYPPGGLPRPARPPYPELDPGFAVQPAPRPAS
jgi:hypothetical protein